MEHRPCAIPGTEVLYLVREDGMIWSRRKGKYIKPSSSKFGYLMVYLTPLTGKGRWHGVGRIVALTYIGPVVGDASKVWFNDRDGGNLHYTNLRWATAYECNMAHTSENDKSNTPRSGRGEGSRFSEKSRQKISLASSKAITVFDGVRRRTYPSIDIMIDLDPFPFKMYYKKLERILKSGGQYKGYIFVKERE